jgi:non-ribosomal peptide synthetase component F/acyl carrier protein
VADFAVWQREWLSDERLRAEVAAWRVALAGAPLRLDLPTDRPRPARRGTAGARRRLALPAAASAALAALATARGVTPFTLLLAAWSAVLARWSGAEEVLVGTVAANRPWIELEAVVGCFVNTLALRCDLAGGADVATVVERLRGVTLAAFAHQELPFEKLVEALALPRDPSRTPLVEAVLVLQSAPLDLRLPGLAVEVVEVATATAKFDLTLDLTATAAGYAGSLEYATELFDAATAERLAGHCINLLQALTAAPAAPLLALPLLSPPEQTQLAREWGEARRPGRRVLVLDRHGELAPIGVAGELCLAGEDDEVMPARSGRGDAAVAHSGGGERAVACGGRGEVARALVHTGRRVRWCADGRLVRAVAAEPVPRLAGAGTPGLWPVGAGGGAAARPLTRIEGDLARLFGAVLGIDAASLTGEANFFSLGGHSLLGARLLVRVQRELGVALPLSAMFERPTLAGLAALIAASPLVAGSSYPAAGGAAAASSSAAASPGPMAGATAAPAATAASASSLATATSAVSLATATTASAAASAATGAASATTAVDATAAAAPAPGATPEPAAGPVAGVAEIPTQPRTAAGLPLSFAQERLHFLEALEPGSGVYHIPAAARLRGGLDVAALAAALGEIVRRHEALRTRFWRAADGEPRQAAVAWRRPAVPLCDLAGLPAAVRAAAAARVLDTVAALPFDLAGGVLLRAALVRVAAREHVLLVSIHHIAADGWSLGVLLDELARFYAAARPGGSPAALPELAVQYADYAAWQRARLAGERLEGELRHWHAALAGAPASLGLPADRAPAGGRRTLRGATVPVAVGAAPSAAAQGLAMAMGVTPFMLLAAAWSVVMGRFAGVEEVLVGTAVANRPALALEPLIGCFVNTLALRCDLGGQPALGVLLERVRRTTLVAFQHQELPFEKLVEHLAPERDAARTPLIETLLVLQNAPLDLQMPGLAVEAVFVTTPTAKLDLTLSLLPTAAGFGGFLEYAADRFEAATAARLVSGLFNLVAAMAANPAARVMEVPLLTPAERAELAGAPFERPPRRPPPARIAAPGPRRGPVRAASATPGAPAAAGVAEDAAHRDLLVPLAAIWEAILGVAGAAPEDSFFSLGGHSLLASRLLLRVQEEFGVELPLRTVFRGADAGRPGGGDRGGAARRAGGAAAAGAAGVGARSGGSPGAPRRSGGAGSAGGAGGAGAAGGELRAGAAVVPRSAGAGERHLQHARPPAPARGAGGAGARRRPRRAVPPPGGAALAFRGARRRGRGVDRAGGAALRPAAGGSRRAPRGACRGGGGGAGAPGGAAPLRPRRGGLLRGALLRGGGEHQLLLTLHHIVGDGVSLDLVAREMAALYTAAVSGAPPSPAAVPALAVQYADFARWQRDWLRGATLAAEIAWWREELSGARGEPPRLALPADRPRAAGAGSAGGRRTLAVAPAVGAALRALAAGRDASLFMVLGGARRAAGRYGGQSDLALGVPVANRGLPEVEDLVGLFVNTLVLRLDLGGDPGARRAAGACAPGGARRLRASGSALRAAGGGARRHRGRRATRRSSRCFWRCNPSWRRRRSPASRWSFSRATAAPPSSTCRSPSPAAGRWPGATLDSTAPIASRRRRSSGWPPAARAAAGAAAAPERRLSELPLLGAAERHQLLPGVERRAGWAPMRRRTTMHAPWVLQAARRRTAVALAAREAEGRGALALTYGELAARAGAAGRAAGGAGAAPEGVVGICAEPSFDLLVGAARHPGKAGGAYLPLDPAHPPERLAQILADAACDPGARREARLQGWAAGAPRPRARRRGAGEPAAGRPRTADAASRPPPSHPTTPPMSSTPRARPAVPKGVVVPTAASSTACASRSATSPPGARMLQRTRLAFDVSVVELFAPLWMGATVVLAPAARQQDELPGWRLLAEER